MTRHQTAILLIVLLVFASLPGCILTRPATPKETPQAALAKAEQLFNEGNNTEAMLKCIDLNRSDPLMPGLAELRNKIVLKLSQERARVTALRNSTTYQEMGVEVDSKKSVPDTYGIQRRIRGNFTPLKSAPSSMQEALQKKVSVHLEGAPLDAFILYIGKSEGINMISDGLGGGKTMTLHADDVPLSEILDYVSRNLGVSFYVGENIIWATPRTSNQPNVPVFTRLYRLRKGISGDELANPKINIVEAIERFIPKEDGADLLFDKKAHVLIVKNTRENMAHIEDLIETLDVCPPQVLIEARFMSTTVTDLRELGIDWILNSPIAVTRKGILNNNSKATAVSTEINATDPKNIVGFTPFPNDAQGLNFSYQGLLTDPLFKAVLHALDISGKARTLSVPKVTTVNNHPALIRIGEDFRYFEEYDVQSIPGTLLNGVQTYESVLVPVGAPKVEELGITLNVTPSVGGDMSSITLKMTPEISEFLRYEYYDVGNQNSTTTPGATATNTMSMVKLPIFRKSKIETEVIVQSGETVVMGGLVSSTENTTKSGIPILSDIPIIGRLFRHDGTEEKKQNLLIFVTATILSERGENLVPITEETEKPAGGAAPAARP